MTYDDKLAARIRKVLATRPDIAEKKMFGCDALYVHHHARAASGATM